MPDYCVDYAPKNKAARNRGCVDQQHTVLNSSNPTAARRAADQMMKDCGFDLLDYKRGKPVEMTQIDDSGTPTAEGQVNKQGGEGIQPAGVDPSVAEVEPGHHEQLNQLYGEGCPAPSASGDMVKVEQGGEQPAGAGAEKSIPQPGTVEWFEARLEHLKETLPYADGKAYGDQKQAIYELQQEIDQLKRDQEPKINSHPEPVDRNLLSEVHDTLSSGELDPTHLLQLVAHLVEDETLDPFAVAEGNISLNLAMDGAMGGLIDE